MVFIHENSKKEGGASVERNIHFEAAKLTDIAVRLAWAQLEIFADDVEKIQVMAAGDESSVTDLRIEIRENALVVEQPQYGLSLNIVDSHWMQVCVRVPRTWAQALHLNTISGLLSARGLNGSTIVMDTISADLQAARITAQELSLKTISGDVRGEALSANNLSVRSVSGSLSISAAAAKVLKGNSISGGQDYHLSSAFQSIDVVAVSGNVMITSPVEAMNVSMRSVSGRVHAEGVTVTEAAGAPKVRVTGVSADLKLISAGK